MDRTLILVKPDAFARGLTGEIIARFERKGLKIVALRHMTVDERPRRRRVACGGGSVCSSASQYGHTFHAGSTGLLHE